MPQPILKHSLVSLNERSYGAIGQFVRYQGEKWQIISRYYRRAHDLILYDLRRDTTGSGTYVHLAKVPHTDISGRAGDHA